MLSIKDVIKNSFLNNFMETISLSTLVLTGITSAVFAYGIYIIYLLTCDKTIYSKKFNVAMSCMTVITSFLVMSMQANIVISLGMVGALSIVRFRTAIKEPKDLLFLFWAISNGIIIGAGLYSISFVLAIVLGLTLLGFELIPARRNSMLLVVNLKSLENESIVEEKLKRFNVKYNVKSRNVLKNKVDLMYEIYTKKDKELLIELDKSKEIISLNLIKQN